MGIVVAAVGAALVDFNVLDDRLLKGSSHETSRVERRKAARGDGRPEHDGTASQRQAQATQAANSTAQNGDDDGGDDGGDGGKAEASSGAAAEGITDSDHKDDNSQPPQRGAVASSVAVETRDSAEGQPSAAEGETASAGKRRATAGALSAAELRHLSSFYSAPRDEHPSIRNLRILTAGRIDDVLASSPPFLLYLYDPKCAACALYTPIIHALSYALDDRDDDVDRDEDEDADDAAQSQQQQQQRREAVRLYSMNDATDYKPGFLSPDEEGKLPLLKFFPQSAASASVPVLYTGSPRLSALLSFLHKQTGGSFDLERAQRRAQSRLPLLQAELQQRGRERLQRSEDWALYLSSPCGDLIRDYSLAELMVKYADSDEGGAGEREAEAKYALFTRCMEEREDDAIDYFETMAAIADETVREMRNKQRRRAQQQEHAHENEAADER